MKSCCKCKQNKIYDNFHKSKNNKDGYHKVCKLCQKEYYNLNKEAIIKAAKNSQKKNKVKRKQYLKHYSKLWRLNNKDKNCYKSSNYRARKQKAMPSWTDKKTIKQIYSNCPKNYHVDHIIPLNGKDVCGLHVPWNLQYLPAIENIKKSNKTEIYCGQLQD